MGPSSHLAQRPLKPQGISDGYLMEQQKPRRWNTPTHQVLARPGPAHGHHCDRRDSLLLNDWSRDIATPVGITPSPTHGWPTPFFPPPFLQVNDNSVSRCVYPKGEGRGKPQSSSNRTLLRNKVGLMIRVENLKIIMLSEFKTADKKSRNTT